MSLKIKLTSTILAFCLILGLLVMGVFATSQATVNLGGSLSFSATNVHAKVTGSVSGAENTEEANSKLPDLTFMEGRDSTAEASHDADVLSWADAGLQFTNEGDAIVIVLSIENLATDRPVYGTISLADDMSTQVKSTVTRVASESATTGEPYAPGALITLEPQKEGNTSKLYFRLVIELKDKNTSLTSGSKWGYVVELDSTTTISASENTNTGISFTKGTYNTLSLKEGSSELSAFENIPNHVIVNGLIYPVTSIPYDAFINFGLSVEKIVIPEGITTINGDFTGGNNFSTNTIIIPSTVSYIADRTFLNYNSTNLVIIVNSTIPATLGGSVVFADQAQIKVPAGCISAYAQAWGMDESRFAEISA